MLRINRGRVVLAISLMVLFCAAVAFAGNTAWQSRPIWLGTSGGSISDMSRLYCCGGTLGALVKDGSNNLYILSNNHVLAKTNLGKAGDDIIQPGLIDQSPSCYKDTADAVADLTKFVTISFKKNTTNKVDAAIAKIRSGAVDTSGAILDIGQISSVIAAPALNMQVKKSGRTTGFTTGYVSAVNVTVSVTYNKTCGVGSQTAKFTGQIKIGPAGFSSGGDSGSLIVENCSSYPRAVGLLFAGSSTTTFANPITNVLSSLGVSMVGSSSYCTYGGKGTSGLPLVSNRAIAYANRVKSLYEAEILAIDGVVGMGVGYSDTAKNRVAIEIYVKKPVSEMRSLLPDSFETIPATIIETGEIFAF